MGKRILDKKWSCKGIVKTIFKAPKIYLSDSVLACYLSGVESLEPTGREPLAGAMFETYVAQTEACIQR